MGKADFLIFSASAEGFLNASLQTSPFLVDIDGSVRGCINTIFGDKCKSIGVGVIISKSGVKIK
jgi:hypothetical protein